MRWVKVLLLGLVTVATGCTTPQSNSAPAQLVGIWHQDEAECAGAAPVRELIFEADGHYSVTWLPFETYKDYWGAWRYDAHTRVLTLTVEGGNYQPTDRVLSGTVSVDTHQLTLGAVSLGSPHNGARCTAPFRR
ncbi:MAG: hypothetical protein JSS00_02755 [Proteobacteria bacterium]|nr:hypothetical protein [Pseudomonadota bacterium]